MGKGMDINMSERELRGKVYDIVMEVSRCSRLHTFARTENQKMAYKIQIEEAVDELLALVTDEQLNNPQPNESGATNQQLREFTVIELSRFNGVGGNPAYVAVNGNVYDVSGNIHWADGLHFGLTAGQNHSEDFSICHSGMQQILELLPIVGKLV